MKFLPHSRHFTTRQTKPEGALLPLKVLMLYESPHAFEIGDSAVLPSLGGVGEKQDPWQKIDQCLLSKLSILKTFSFTVQR